MYEIEPGCLRADKTIAVTGKNKEIFVLSGITGNATLPATNPAAAVIGAVPEGTFIRLLVMKGVEAAAIVIATVPVLITNLLLWIEPRKTVATFLIA